MQTVVICEMFGWTYWEYLEQPVAFVNLIKEKLRVDAHNASKATKKWQQKQK